MSNKRRRRKKKRARRLSQKQTGEKGTGRDPDAFENSPDTEAEDFLPPLSDEGRKVALGVAPIERIEAVRRM